MVTLLQNKQKTLSVAESLTGGWFQKELVDISGSSTVFAGGVVTYKTNTKANILGIGQALIEQYSVVSKECAIAMADHVRKLFKTDFGIAFTGLAEVPKNSQETPIVFYAIAQKDKKTKCYQLNLFKQRNVNRYTVVLQGMNTLRKLLEEKDGN